MANSSPVSLNLTSLDYDSLQASLQAFVAATQEFKSYDLTSGGMSAIVKLLAYNSWQYSFLLNMIASESFLDSAQLRTSVISHAKELNYTPRSACSAVATVSVSWQGDQPTYFLQKGQTFSALVKGAGALSFSVPETVVVSSGNGSFATTLNIYEGPFVSDAYVMDYSDPTLRFIVTNPDVDASSITVAVYENSSSTPVTFARATTLLGVTENSQVWFLQCSETGQYEVQFGDGVVGELPTDGSRVVIDYRVTQGSAGNGARTFSIGFNPFPSDATNLLVTTVTPSTGGSDPESIESIRFRAPRYFQMQERAVTAQDYSLLLMEAFPEVTDAFAYGGEDANPPQYGRVFVAVDLSSSEGVPASRAQAYQSYLAARCSLTVTPTIVPADRTFASVTSRVTYDPTVSVLTPSTAQSLAVAAIASWGASNLGKFGSALRLSRLVAAIDAADPSFISNQTTAIAYREYSPARGASQSLTIPFGFALEVIPTNPGVVPTLVEQFVFWSGQFQLGGSQVFLADDGLGSVRVVSSVGQSPRYSTSPAGTIDYVSGLVTLSAFAPSDYVGDSIRFYARPAASDLEVPAGTVLALEDEIFVSVTQESE